MTEAEKIHRKFKMDPYFYSQTLLKIKDKQGNLTQLRYNSPQKKLERIYRDLVWKHNKPVRLIVLKARQQGVSTWTQSHMFHGIVNFPNTHALTIAHDDDSTTNLFRMSQLFYDELPKAIEFPDGSAIAIKPDKKHSNRYELSFKDNRSQLRIQTAGSKTAGRSQTLRYLHCSEVAFWPAPEETMGGLMQALADTPGTFAVIESTANGVGGYFYNMWQAAKAGKNEWVPVFIAWFESPEYTKPFESEEQKQAFIATMDNEEKLLQKEYNLTLEQLNWRRWTIENKCNGDVEYFRQEYPANDAEAFLVSGRPFFNRDVLIDVSKTVRPGVRGNLEWANKAKTSVKFVLDRNGYVEFWKAPDEKKGCYAIGADVAEGLKDGDYSAAEVIDRDTGEQVAEWHGHIDPDLFGEELVKLAVFYNRAWLGIEANNHGLTTIKSAVRLKYNRLYQRQTDFDKRHEEQTKRIGWKTTSVTRPLMLDDLAKAIREKSIKINSGRLIGECLSFVRNKKGKPEAEHGCHDDTVMAAGIALQVHKTCPMSRPISRQEVRRRMERREQLIQPSVSSITGY